jgi:integrase
MTPLRQALADYLAVRRALGARLHRAEKLLGQYLSYVEARGEPHLRVPTMVAWATLPPHAARSWASLRLSVVRAFAAHLQTFDPQTEVPPTGLIPSPPCRATPYLYTDQDIAALMTATSQLQTPHRVATYRTLLGLLAVTGLRVGEALALDWMDLDAAEEVLTIRTSKFGKSREVPVHATTITALRRYLHRHDRPRAAARTTALFVSTAGTRLLYCNVQWTFQRLVRQAHLVTHATAGHPRLHDFRHRFAVCTLVDSYRHGADPHARLAILSTYLGHADPRHTYWYLSATPQLLRLAADRLERQRGGAA